jgi:hypothetical protein
MNVEKLSISTRMAMANNFGFPKGQDGTIGAFVKVSKNIDKELKDLGASIQGFMQGQTTGELFTIRFPVSSLGKISEIDGLVYLDIGEKSTMQPPKINPSVDKDLLNNQYQDAINQQNALNQQNNSTSKYIFNQDFEATTRVVKRKGVGDYTENIDYITLKYKFKKGDIFDGKKIPVNAGINPESKKYNIQITTPKSIRFDGSDYVGQVTYEIDDSLVSEATPLQKNKKYLIIIGALVIGYLAYKKFNK